MFTPRHVMAGLHPTAAHPLLTHIDMCRRRAATWSIKVGMESHATASCRKSTDAALVAGRCLPP